MYLAEIKPISALSAFVRIFRIIDFNFPDDSAIPAKAYTPRPEQCLQFFPSPTVFNYPGSSKNIIPKDALLIGQHTVVNSRTIFKKFLSLQIVFQPGALCSLLNTPFSEFTNQLIEAEDIFGKEIGFINEQLYHAACYDQMIRIAENFVVGLVRKADRDISHLAIISQQMLEPNSRALDWFVSNSYLCHRQFDRKFIEQVGISPKEYMKIVRFDQAYRMKNRFPEMSWFDIAVACNYYDYQHLSKDYQTFTGYTPPKFFSLDSPERLLGREEVY